MKRKYKLLIITILTLSAGSFIYKSALTVNPNPKFAVGQILDSLNHVYVYYNGGVGHVGEKNKSKDGYNIGLKFQCVEFVKRYYLECYEHKMPDAYGNAKDFFNPELPDGKMNEQRNLIQYRNPSKLKPQVGDLIIFDSHRGNPYGHVAIISNVTDNQIEIIQQNPGPFASSRVKYGLGKMNDNYNVEHDGTLGWLRMK